MCNFSQFIHSSTNAIYQKEIYSFGTYVSAKVLVTIEMFYGFFLYHLHSRRRRHYMNIIYYLHILGYVRNYKSFLNMKIFYKIDLMNYRIPERLTQYCFHCLRTFWIWVMEICSKDLSSFLSVSVRQGFLSVMCDTLMLIHSFNKATAFIFYNSIRFNRLHISIFRQCCNILSYKVLFSVKFTHKNTTFSRVFFRRKKELKNLKLNYRQFDLLNSK